MSDRKGAAFGARQHIETLTAENAALRAEVDRLNVALRDERDLHYDTLTENAALRRRLVEAGATDPADEVGE